MVKPKAVVQKKTKILVAGQTGILINIARCCSPSVNNNIKAYITKKHEASIHKANCENLKRAQKKWPQKVIEATWSDK